MEINETTRIKALELAVASRGHNESGDEVVARAALYAQYIAGPQKEEVAPTVQPRPKKKPKDAHTPIEPDMVIAEKPEPEPIPMDVIEEHPALEVVEEEEVQN